MNKYFYIYVEYDDENKNIYCYTSKDLTIRKGNKVLVERGSNDDYISATVINTKFYKEDEVPYPFSKLKYITRKIPSFLNNLYFDSCWDSIDEKVVAKIILELKSLDFIKLKEVANEYNIDNYNTLSYENLINKIIKIERSNEKLDQELIDEILYEKDNM